MNESREIKVVKDAHYEQNSDGELDLYFEQYEGYFSQGWRTTLDSDTAYEVLTESALLGTENDFDVEQYPDGSWTVSIDTGTYYWNHDHSGSLMAGVLSPDDGLSQDDIERWRTLTTATEVNNGD